MSQDEQNKKSTVNEIDVYVERNEYKIKLHVRAILAERKVSLRDLLTMKNEQFEQMQDWLHEKRVPVSEIKALYNFRYADDSPVFGPKRGDMKKKGEEKMKIGDLPAGERKLTHGRLGTLGGFLVTSVDQFRTNIMFGEREINIPTDMVKSDEGVWGTLYSVNYAKYVDDGKKIPKEVALELQQHIEAAYTKNGSYVEFE